MSSKLLKTCVENLKEIRAGMHEKTDSRIKNELNEVIEMLETSCSSKHHENAHQLTVSILNVLAKIAESCPELVDLLQFFN